MQAHSPIGSCCSRPRFNGVGGVDLETWSHFCRMSLNARAARIRDFARRARASGPQSRSKNLLSRMNRL